MNAVRTVTMWISSRSTVRSISWSTPGRRMEISTVVPLGPLMRLGLLARIGPPRLRLFLTDFGDDVVAADSRLVGRRTLEERDHRNLAVDREDADADPEVRAHLPLAHLRERARIQERRVRIERAQHAVDRSVDELLLVERLDVVVLNGVERGQVHPVPLIGAILPRRHFGSEHAAGECRQNHHDGCRRKSFAHWSHRYPSDSVVFFFPNIHATMMLTK
jgi:hypothetical protein